MQAVIPCSSSFKGAISIWSWSLSLFPVPLFWCFHSLSASAHQNMVKKILSLVAPLDLWGELKRRGPRGRPIFIDIVGTHYRVRQLAFIFIRLIIGHTKKKYVLARTCTRTSVMQKRTHSLKSWFFVMKNIWKAWMYFSSGAPTKVITLVLKSTPKYIFHCWTLQLYETWILRLNW